MGKTSNMRYVKAPEKPKPSKYPLLDASSLDSNQTELDRQAALVINLLKQRMINRQQIARTIDEIENETDREFYRDRINQYLTHWKDK